MAKETYDLWLCFEPHLKMSVEVGQAVKPFGLRLNPLVQD